MTHLTSFRAPAALALAALLGACAARTQMPGSLSQAQQIYARLSASPAQQRVEADLIRARESIAAAQTAFDAHQNQEFVNGLGDIALRSAQVAEARDARVAAVAQTDSLRSARLRRLLTLSEAQRSALSTQAALTAEENSALRQQNASVSQQADSLRRVAEAANAQLNQALTQLRTLVVEITNLRETNRGLVISLSDILFDVNKATLKPGADQNVRRIAAILKQYPSNQISVEGHTDNTGGAALNQTLSEQRAASVRAALVAGGVDPNAITSRGFGPSQPVSSNANATGRQQNRRVEVVVLGAGSLADAARASGAAGTPPAGGTTPPR